MELEKKQLEIIKENDFEAVVDGEMDQVELRQRTPAGEDWAIVITIEKNSSFLEELKEMAEDTSWADDDLAMWLEAKNHNTCRGIPDVDDLINDTAWKKAVVQKLYNDLEKGLVGKRSFYELDDGAILSMKQVEEVYRFQERQYRLNDAKVHLDNYFDDADNFSRIFKRDMAEALEDELFLGQFVARYADYANCDIAENITWDEAIKAVITDYEAGH